MMRRICLILISLCLHTRVANAAMSLQDRIKGVQLRSDINSAPVVQNQQAATVQVVKSVPEVKVVKGRKGSTKKSSSSAKATATPIAQESTSLKKIVSKSKQVHTKIHTKKSTTKSDGSHKKITAPKSAPAPVATPSSCSYYSKKSGSKKSSSRRILQSKGGKGGSKGSKKCYEGGKGSKRSYPYMGGSPSGSSAFSGASSTSSGASSAFQPVSVFQPVAVVQPVSQPVAVIQPVAVGAPAVVPVAPPTGRFLKKNSNSDSSNLDPIPIGSKRKRLY